MSIKLLFNRIVDGETVTLLHRDYAEFKSTAVMLRRKWKAHQTVICGFDDAHPSNAQYIRCLFDSTAITGTYQLVGNELRPGEKVYTELL
jgi:hypothetical protein